MLEAHERDVGVVELGDGVGGLHGEANPRLLLHEDGGHVHLFRETDLVACRTARKSDKDRSRI